ncbi:chaplin [Streptomyces sp. NBC_01236]|uniref:chaplin n=1 Tax=Streptomyces sp. NBC_01236 TaxID=2903789 RepID=UPI003FA3D386
MVVAAAATGILSLYATPGFADSNANGAATDSPGVASGNNVQVPVHVPVNACGNTVNVIAALNPAFGNSCSNGSSSQPLQGAPVQSPGDDASSVSGSSAHGEAHDSPGVLSGDIAQAPVDVPVNACGNAVDVIGALNPAFGNKCANEGPLTPPVVTPPATPVGVPPVVTPPATPVGVPPVVTPPATPVGVPPVVTPPATPVGVPPVVTPPATPVGVPPVVTPPATPVGVPPVVTPPATPVGVPPAVTPPTITRTAHPSLKKAHPATPPNTPYPTGQEQLSGASSTLARTGSEGVLAASAASVALLAGGTLLYRRGRAASRR